LPLVDRSLVVAEEESGAMRYRLLETLCQYAARRLAQRSEDARWRDRHRDWCVALAERGASLTFWRALGDTRGLAVSLFFRGLTMGWTGANLAAAWRMFEESLALAQQRGPRWTVYFCLYCIGEAARVEGDLVRAEELWTIRRPRKSRLRIAPSFRGRLPWFPR
jgi:hypothetical protein